MAIFMALLGSLLRGTSTYLLTRRSTLIPVTQFSVFDLLEYNIYPAPVPSGPSHFGLSVFTLKVLMARIVLYQHISINVSTMGNGMSHLHNTLSLQS